MHDPAQPRHRRHSRAPLLIAIAALAVIAGGGTAWALASHGAARPSATVHPAAKVTASPSSRPSPSTPAACGRLMPVMDTVQARLGARDVPGAETALRGWFRSLPDRTLKVDVGVALEQLDKWNLDALAGRSVSQDTKDVTKAFSAVYDDC